MVPFLVIFPVASTRKVPVPPPVELAILELAATLAGLELAATLAGLELAAILAGMELAGLELATTLAGLELAAMLAGLELAGVELATTPEQTAPVTLGVSAAAELFLLPWKPNSTVWPG
jgi:hypothetical protein